MRRRATPADTGDNPAPAARDWAAVFPGDSSRAAYQQAFRAHTPAAWDVVASGQGDLLRLLINRVPADIGVGVVFGLAVLFGAHPKGDDAGRAMLATIVAELEPPRARTLLVTLSDAWLSAEGRAFDRRPAAIQTDFARAVRRLAALNLPAVERDALDFLADQLADVAPAMPVASEIVPRERHDGTQGFLKTTDTSPQGDA